MITLLRLPTNNVLNPVFSLSKQTLSFIKNGRFKPSSGYLNQNYFNSILSVNKRKICSIDHVKSIESIDDKISSILIYNANNQLSRDISDQSKKISDKVLRTLFQDAVQELELESQTKFEDSIKEKIWNNVSVEKLQILGSTFTKEFFMNFSFMDQKVLLCAAGPAVNAHIHISFSMKKELAVDAVVKKAKSLADPWIQEIIKSSKEEGIDFPISK